MNDPAVTPPTPAPAAATVSFTADDALAIVNTIGSLAAAVVPGEAQLVALVTGAASLLRNTIMPAIQHLSSHELSVAEQATLAAESAAERARVGAPPSASN
jgi:hypothetical protein